MDFPDIYCVSKEGFSVLPETGRELMRADNGKPRIRDLWIEPRYSITFNLFPMSPSQVEAVRQFYESYKATEIVWRDPWSENQPYTVIMLDEPVITRYEGKWAMLQVTMDGRRGE